MKILLGIHSVHGNIAISVYDESKDRFNQLRAVEVDEASAVVKMILSNDEVKVD